MGCHSLGSSASDATWPSDKTLVWTEHQQPYSSMQLTPCSLPASEGAAIDGHGAAGIKPLQDNAKEAADLQRLADALLASEGHPELMNTLKRQGCTG